MVGGYAKFGTEALTAAAERIERGRDENVIDLSRFCDVSKEPFANVRRVGRSPQAHAPDKRTVALEFGVL